MIITKIYINNEFFKTFENEKVKEFLIEWDGKISVGRTLETKKGKMKIVNASIENPNKNNGNNVVELFLEE